MGFSLRTDSGFALVAGGLIALFSLFLCWSFWDSLPFGSYASWLIVLVSFLWLFLAPLGALVALSVAKRLPQQVFPFYRFFRYGIIGALNTVLNLSVFNAFMLATGVSSGYLINFFTSATYVVTITHSFLWNKYAIFENQESGAAGQYAKFFMVSGATGLFAVGFVHLLVNVVGAPEAIEERTWANIAALLAIPISVLGNFGGYSLLVFKKKEQI